MSQPYMTTGKNIALTRQTFVGKVMSLLFNMLSRLVITFLPRSKHLLISLLQSPSAVILEPPKIKLHLGMWRMQQFHQKIVVTIYPGEMSVVSLEVESLQKAGKGWMRSSTCPSIRKNFTQGLTLPILRLHYFLKQNTQNQISHFNVIKTTPGLRGRFSWLIWRVEEWILSRLCDLSANLSWLMFW